MVIRKLKGLFTIGVVLGISLFISVEAKPAFDACEITSKDVELRQAYLKLRYRKEVSLDEARDQLQRACDYSKILSQFGEGVVTATLDEQMKRIEKETASPALLRRIKNIYGVKANTKSNDEYLKGFVLPLATEQKTIALFNKLESKNELSLPQAKDSFDLAKDFWIQAESKPAQFRKIARRLHYPVQKIVLDSCLGIRVIGPEKPSREERDLLAQKTKRCIALAKKNKFVPHAEFTKWVDEHYLKLAKDGKIVPKITEDETAYLVIKRHHQTVVKARFIRIGVEVARIEKKTSSNAVATNIDFSTWTSAQIDSVSN